jgi:uncharacterized protein (DUF488 family)
VPDIVFTIGHSTHSSEKLVGFLRRYGITAIADVRSQPYSRMNPQFNRETLQSTLKGAGVAYVFLGRELGARTEDRSCYVDGKVEYDRLAQTPLFKEGLDRVEKGSRRYCIALLCAERDPLTCHRTILVARHLVARGLRSAHILGNGGLESHDDALNRLLREVGVSDRDFFKNRQELIDEAYAKRGSEIAYVEKPSTPNDFAVERYVP